MIDSVCVLCFSGLYFKGVTLFFSMALFLILSSMVFWPFSSIYSKDDFSVVLQVEEWSEIFQSAGITGGQLILNIHVFMCLRRRNKKHTVPVASFTQFEEWKIGHCLVFVPDNIDCFIKCCLFFVPDNTDWFMKHCLFFVPDNTDWFIKACLFFVPDNVD